MTKEKTAKCDWDGIIAKTPREVEKFVEDWGVLPSIREIFYGFVGEELPNTKGAYKYFDARLVDARLSGLIPFGLFRLDEEREPAGGDSIFLTPDEKFRNALDRLRRIPSEYGLPRWEGQPYQVIIVVEKTGERDPIWSATRDLSVPVMPGRGYAAWESLASLAEDLKEYHGADEKKIAAIYIGDFDPTGEDIPRFVKAALEHFFPRRVEYFEKLAITREQVKRFRLPYRPEDEEEIKKLKKDPRFKNKKRWPYGLYRVEVEALLKRQPEYVKSLVRSAVERFFDVKIHERNKPQEEKLRAELAEKIEKLLRRTD